MTKDAPNVPIRSECAQVFEQLYVMLSDRSIAQSPEYQKKEKVLAGIRKQLRSLYPSCFKLECEKIVGDIEEAMVTRSWSSKSQYIAEVNARLVQSKASCKATTPSLEYFGLRDRQDRDDKRNGQTGDNKPGGSNTKPGVGNQ